MLNHDITVIVSPGDADIKSASNFNRARGIGTTVCRRGGKDQQKSSGWSFRFPDKKMVNYGQLWKKKRSFQRTMWGSPQLDVSHIRKMYENVCEIKNCPMFLGISCTGHHCTQLIDMSWHINIWQFSCWLVRLVVPAGAMGRCQAVSQRTGTCNKNWSARLLEIWTSVFCFSDQRLALSMCWNQRRIMNWWIMMYHDDACHVPEKSGDRGSRWICWEHGPRWDRSEQ